MYHILVILGLVLGTPVIIITIIMLIGVISNEPIKKPQPAYLNIQEGMNGRFTREDFEIWKKFLNDSNGDIVQDEENYLSNPNGNYKG